MLLYMMYAYIRPVDRTTARSSDEMARKQRDKRCGLIALSQPIAIS